MGSSVYATPSSYSHASPQQVISPVSHAGTPGSSQPYTCYVCSATATSRKNYIAHLQGRAHLRQVQRAGSEVARWRDDGSSGASPAPSTADMPGVEGSPWHCPMCGVWTSSQLLLDAHFKGRRHLKRALEQADADATHLGLHPPSPLDTKAPKTPTATQFYCEVCEVFATSEEQLAMHNEGKKHKRTLALHQLTHPHLLPHSSRPDAGGAIASEDTLLDGSQQAFTCTICGVTASSQEQFDYHMAGQRHRAKAAATLPGPSKMSAISTPASTAAHTDSPDRPSHHGTPQRPLPSPLAQLAGQEPPVVSAAPAVSASTSSRSSSPDSSEGEGRGIVTARRDLNFGAEDVNKSKPPATSDSIATAATAGQPAATAAHPPVRRSVSFSKEVLKPADGGVRAEAQQGVFDVSALPDGVTAIPVADPDDPSLIVMQFFCPACGIATTSEANLQDHLGGRKHARRVQHLAKASLMQAPTSLAPAFGGEGLLSREPSGNVYDNFPCVRVGDYDLPSSMDLRQYLDEMQEVGDWEGDPADLPTIPDDEEAHHPIATDGTPSVARLNSMNSLHRRRRSGSGSGALLDMSRVDMEGGGAPSTETSPQSSRGFLHKYKGSMDARSFQQHAARVAEMTDALLAERAAAKAGSSPTTNANTNPQTDRRSPETDAVSSSDQTPHPPDATPSATPSQGQTLYSSALQRASVSGQSGMQTSADTDDAQHQHIVTDGAQQSASKQGFSAHVSAPSALSAALPASTVAAGPAAGHAFPASSATGHAFPATAADSLAGCFGGPWGPHYCTICNVSTTSAVHLQTHYMGSKHQRRLAQAQTGVDQEPGPHYCAICGISATSDVHMQLHLNGRAHQRKAKLVSEGSPEGYGGQPSSLDEPGTAQSQAASRQDSGRSSTTSGRQAADVLSGGAEAVSSSGSHQHHDTATRLNADGRQGMLAGTDSVRHTHPSYHRDQQLWQNQASHQNPGSYSHLQSQQYRQQPPQQHHMQPGQLQNMQGRSGPAPNSMGNAPRPQGILSPGYLQNIRGHPGNSPSPQGMMGPAPGPQGMLSPGHAPGPHRGPLSSPQGHGGHVTRGAGPMNGGMQGPMQYMGYYPSAYFNGQSAGPVAMPGYVPQAWWGSQGPGLPLPGPNGLQLPGICPAATGRGQPGMPLAFPLGYGTMPGN